MMIMNFGHILGTHQMNCILLTRMFGTEIYGYGGFVAEGLSVARAAAVRVWEKR